MLGRRQGGRSARRRAAALSTCAVIAAVLGGAALAAPANASTCSPSNTSVGPSATPSSLTGCDASAGTGDPAASDDRTARPDVDPATPAPSSTDDPAVTDPPAPTDPSASPSISATPASGTLADLMLDRSSNTVYPVKDGYQDTVRFAITAVAASGQAVQVQGCAILSKAGREIRTWQLDGASAVITWNGRVGTRIENGLYTLVVRASSADGTERTTSAHVRVLSKHLQRNKVVVHSNVGAKSFAASLPRQLLKAYAHGLITVRVRTVASVHGPAELVFSNEGVTRSIVLKHGVHITPSLPVPLGFDHVTITHAWKKGTVHLRSLTAIWTYYTLV